MKSYIIISQDTLDFSKIVNFLAIHGDTYFSSENRLVCEGDNAWSAIEKSEHVRKEYSETEIEFIERIIPSPNFYIIEFSTHFHANLYLKFIKDNGPFVIDNDHGALLNYEDIIRLNQSGLDWTEYRAN